MGTDFVVIQSTCPIHMLWYPVLFHSFVQKYMFGCYKRRSLSLPDLVFGGLNAAGISTTN